jgi:hypothetical protein
MDTIVNFWGIQLCPNKYYWHCVSDQFVLKVMREWTLCGFQQKLGCSLNVIKNFLLFFFWTD